MSAQLTHQDRAELAEILRDVIEADYPFSPKVKRRKELLSKLDPEPDRVAIPYPPPKPSAQQSHMLAKKPRR